MIPPVSKPPRKPSPVAGGAPIAIATIIGAIIGMGRGQPSLGVLIGFGVGAAIALLIWAVSARRS